jgi:hypothetical protein
VLTTGLDRLGVQAIKKDQVSEHIGVCARQPNELILFTVSTVRTTAFVPQSREQGDHFGVRWSRGVQAGIRDVIQVLKQKLDVLDIDGILLFHLVADES